MINADKFIEIGRSSFFQHGIRYCLVGIWNTVFGLGLYTVLILIFSQEHYLLLGVLTHVIAATNAFLCYKYFVFKTKGNFWREYFKCHLVYAGGMLTGLIGLYVCVSILGFNAIYSNFAITCLNFCLSFLEHKYFSFEKENPPIQAVPIEAPDSAQFQLKTSHTPETKQTKQFIGKKVLPA